MEDLNYHQQSVITGRPDNLAAFDLGFNSVKALINDRTVLMSSAMAHAPASMDGLGHSQKVFELDAGRFVFGKDALKPGNKTVNSLTTKWLIDSMPGLICAAADQAKVDLSTVTRIATGLPLNAWIDFDESVAESLKTIRCNREVYNFDEVRVYSQGAGALALHAKTAPKGQNGIVLDVGGNTILAVRFENLRPVCESTREYDGAGVLSAAKSMTAYLSEFVLGRKVTSMEAMAAILNPARTFNHHDIGAKIDEVLADYCHTTLTNFREDFGQLANELDCLVVAGGGAYLLGKALDEEYPRVVILPQPEFANVQGYAWLSK